MGDSYRHVTILHHLIPEHEDSPVVFWKVWRYPFLRAKHDRAIWQFNLEKILVSSVSSLIRL